MNHSQLILKVLDIQNGNFQGNIGPFYFPWDKQMAN